MDSSSGYKNRLSARGRFGIKYLWFYFLAVLLICGNASGARVLGSSARVCPLVYALELGSAYTLECGSAYKRRYCLPLRSFNHPVWEMLPSHLFSQMSNATDSQMIAGMVNCDY